MMPERLSGNPLNSISLDRGLTVFLGHRKTYSGDWVFARACQHCKQPVPAAFRLFEDATVRCRIEQPVLSPEPVADVVCGTWIRVSCGRGENPRLPFYGVS